MGRMTNRERDVIVDEIYSKVSLPIVKSNKEIIANTKIKESDYEYLKDAKTYKKIKDKIEEFKKGLSLIARKYADTISESGHDFNYYQSSVMGDSEQKKFIEHEKKIIADLKTPPSKDEIEKQVILAGNKDIPALIEELTLKLKG